jgi:hypothetical protein
MKLDFLENDSKILVSEIVNIVKFSIYFFFVQVMITHYMYNLDIFIKKQIQNELIRSCNSMIQDIRREIFEKMTRTLRSQGVYVLFPSNFS